MKSLLLNNPLKDRLLARSQARQQAHDRYTIRLAQSEADVRAAQGLRFLVFNLELKEGLDQSFATRLDADPFDPVCDHLIVEDAASGQVVGTYRLQTGRTAGARLGYYSAQEFEFAPFEPVRDEIVELGRACVHIEHRNLAVLGLLWKGIAAYAREQGGRYLIGCSSLSSQSEPAGASAYAELSRRHLVEARWRTHPLAAYRCSLEACSPEPPKIPKLLSAYLTLGARICGPPALDREFRTIDFLTFIDLRTLSRRTVERYLS